MKKWMLTAVSIIILVIFSTGCKPSNPVAAFSADVREGNAPLKVFFTDESRLEKSLLVPEQVKNLFLPASTKKAPLIESWEWNFGDGETCTSQHTWHTYDAPGEYTVSLIVRTNKGKMDYVTRKNYISVWEGDSTTEGEVAEGEIAEGESGEGESGEGESGEGEDGTGSCAPDTTPPVITLIGAAEVTIDCGTVYEDAGAAATDNCDGGLTTLITVTNPVNTMVAGTYTVRYNVSDSSSNAANEATRTVVVNDNCPVLGQEIQLNLPGDVPLVLVEIPAGTYQMGRYPGEQDSGGDEEPQHEVVIAESFWMGKFEVTQQQWEAVMETWPGSAPTEEYGVGAASPAYSISWDDAQEFVTALNAYIAESEQGAIAVHLPSEAQWEYAARAGTTTRFYWGDDPSYQKIDNYAWYADNSDEVVHTVGTKQANAFGLYDMAGNLWEWCEDDYHSDYTGAPTDGAPWIDSPRASTRVVRSGSKSDENWGCRLANRLQSPVSRYGNIGFRIAADVATQ